MTRCFDMRRRLAPTYKHVAGHPINMSWNSTPSAPLDRRSSTPLVDPFIATAVAYSEDMAGGGFPSGERLRSLFDSLIDPVVVLGAIRGPDGRIVDFEYLDANAAALEANRTTYGDLMGARLLTLFPEHGPSGLLRVYADVAETGEPVELNDQPYAHEFTLGRVQYYDVRATQVGDGISLTWRDRTELHESLLRLEDEQGRTRATLDALRKAARRG